MSSACRFPLAKDRSEGVGWGDGGEEGWYRLIVTSHHPAGDSAALNSQVSGRCVQPYLGGGLKQSCCYLFYFFSSPPDGLQKAGERLRVGEEGAMEGSYWKRQKGKEKTNNNNNSFSDSAAVRRDKERSWDLSPR